MTFAIILAAGSGLRLNRQTPKQYLTIFNRSLLEHVLMTFDQHSMIDELVIVVSLKDQTLFNKLNIKINKKHHLVIGGQTRQQSVFNSLDYLASFAKKDDIILIHDSARVLIDRQTIERGLLAIKDYDGVTAIINSKDSLISLNQGHHQYLNRDIIYRIQTPQIFRYEAIYNAHKKALKEPITALDDFSLLDKSNKIGYYQGSETNFKLTDENDLLLLKALLKKEEYAQ